MIKNHVYFFVIINLEVIIVGRPKGGKNRTWSKEEKYRIVQRYLLEGVGPIVLIREENITRSMLYKWIEQYSTGGIDALENKTKTGNSFSALWTSKSLTEEERLKLIIQKQEIEIERLKKGYQVKGVGAKKEFVIINDANSK